MIFKLTKNCIYLIFALCHQNSVANNLSNHQFINRSIKPSINSSINHQTNHQTTTSPINYQSQHRIIKFLLRPLITKRLIHSPRRHILILPRRHLLRHRYTIQSRWFSQVYRVINIVRKLSSYIWSYPPHIHLVFLHRYTLRPFL